MENQKYYLLVRIDKHVLIFVVLQLSSLRCCYLIARTPVPLVAQREVTIFVPHFLRESTSRDRKGSSKNFFFNK